MPAIASEHITPRNVVVWLPPGYDRANRRYPVVYMQDGQNLFFVERSSLGKVWAADQSALRLISQRRVQPFIIVGIDQPGTGRAGQYFPQALYEAASPELRTRFDALIQGPVYSDAYLRFIVSDLKPMIDKTYRTKRGPNDTAIVGSSMGGLISIYAFIQYPHVFGRAGGLSTHWPMSTPTAPGEHLREVDTLWDSFFAAKLGKPGGRRLWLDHGTETLDAYYGPYQQSVDRSLATRGWALGRNFESRVYQGAPHEENAWAARLDDVFLWLWAGRRSQQPNQRQ